MNSVQSFFRGGGDALIAGDAFVAKLGRAGSLRLDLSWPAATGTNAAPIAMDAPELYTSPGVKDSTDFRRCRLSYAENAGQRDIFIAKIDPNATLDQPVLIQAVKAGASHPVRAGLRRRRRLRVNDEQSNEKRGSDPTQIRFCEKSRQTDRAGSDCSVADRNANGKNRILVPDDTAVKGRQRTGCVTIRPAARTSATSLAATIR